MDNYHHNFMLEDIFFQTGARESYRDNHLRSAATLPPQRE
jgi:hypothetical protein